MFRLFAVFVVAIGLVPLVFGQEINTYNGPIIDMHMHAANIQRDSEGNPRPSFIGCLPGPCVAKNPIAITEEQVLHLTLDAMDRNNIVLGFLSGYDMSPNAITPNSRRVSRWLTKAPGRFLPSPFISRPGSPPIDGLKAEYSAGKWRGMGEIGTQYAGYAPNDAQLAPYFALAAEFEVPTHIHTLGFGAPIPSFRPSAGNPLLLEEVLTKNPSLRLFVENCSFPFAQEWIAMAYQFPQLHCDVSTVTWIINRDAFYTHLRTLVEAGLSERIMFGSDSMEWPETIDVAVEAIQSAQFLTLKQKANIFYNNAARFLRLSDNEIATHHDR